MSSWPTATWSSRPAIAASAARSASPTNTILVRWQSKSRHYEAERLNLSFVRLACEFTRLPLASIKTGKRVLVRDLLEDQDFCGVSYWLATITAEPTFAK